MSGHCPHLLGRFLKCANCRMILDNNRICTFQKISGNLLIQSGQRFRLLLAAVRDVTDRRDVPLGLLRKTARNQLVPRIKIFLALRGHCRKLHAKVLEATNQTVRIFAHPRQLLGFCAKGLNRLHQIIKFALQPFDLTYIQNWIPPLKMIWPASTYKLRKETGVGCR